MNAREMAEKLKVGDYCHTQAIGDWRGGLCEVIELHPDPDAPEIVMQVRRIEDGDECGVFEDELVHPLRIEDMVFISRSR